MCVCVCVCVSRILTHTIGIVHTCDPTQPMSSRSPMTAATLVAPPTLDILDLDLLLCICEHLPARGLARLKCVSHRYSVADTAAGGPDGGGRFCRLGSQRRAHE